MIEPEYRLIYLLMADAGLRLTEAITLQRSAIEFDHGVMFLTGKGNKERIVPITTDRLLQELEKRRGVEGYLSVNPKTQKPYYDIQEGSGSCREESRD
jgi:integrase